MGHRNLLITFSFCTLFVSLSARENSPSEDRQTEALKEWIATKRQVTVSERGGNLSLSGDIRVKYSAKNEKRNGVKNIGASSRNPFIANDQYSIDFNLLLDYRTDATWGAVKVEFDNTMGIINGTQRGLSLERAFMGFRVYANDFCSLDLMMGRTKMSYVYDSRLQFGSFLDGATLRYSQSADKVGDFYALGSALLINQNFDQFAYVAELGLLNIGDTGVFAKYSIVDWDTKTFKEKTNNQFYQFIPNQFLLGWKFVPPKLQKIATIYGAYIINPVAKKVSQLENSKANQAFYLGSTVGEITQVGDWTLDTTLEYVQPQSIPPFDFDGIGIGNSDGSGLYTTRANGTGAPSTRDTAVTKANYIGWRGQILYVVTNSLTISQTLKISKSLSYLPTKYSYKSYKLEFIYAW